MKLYKFLSTPAALHAVLDGVLKFTRVADLNDPTELVASIQRDRVHESLKKLLLQGGFSDVQFARLQDQGRLLTKLLVPLPIPSSRDEANAFLRLIGMMPVGDLQIRWVEEITAQLAARVGILSLSARFDSLPMWAHYADNARGVVVEYEDLNEDFLGDGTGVLECVKPVTYTSMPSPFTFDPGSTDAIFFEKLKDWSYEHEFRVVVPLAECQQYTLGNGRSFECRKVPKLRVRRVLVGWRVEDRVRAGIRDIVASVSPSVAIGFASVSREGVVRVTT